jgi:F0F1-type ATP synthase assembly protein I
MASPSPAPRKGPGNTVQQISLAMELPLVMVGSVLVAGGIGYLIDRYAHTAPVFTLLGGLCGFGAGIWDIIRRLSADTGKQNPGSGSNGE